MWRKTILICIDGLDPAYLQTARTPTLDAIGREGFFTVGQAVIPSVTNVNNVSIVTGTFPETHGIASNYQYDPATGEGRFVESDESLEALTVFERAKKRGLSTALLVTKKKLLRMLQRGADIALAAEDPPDGWTDAVGPAEPIYSSKIDRWQFRALRHMLREHNPDLTYCSTTDYIMHTYGPDAPEAIDHVETLDRLLGDILTDFPEHRLLITADHGMGDKTNALDLQAILDGHGLDTVYVPVIKDRYVVHHQNMGGVGYVYGHDDEQSGHAAAVLESIMGIEGVYPREEAAALFRLPAERIGDLVILADADTVFTESGTFLTSRTPVQLRTHGSAHETAVPIFGLNCDQGAEAYTWNLDIVRNLNL